MSKKQYIEAFSNIHPSDESIERIMNMTNKKYSVGFRKILVIAAAVIAIICSAGFAADAATDGAVSKTVSEAFDTVSKMITVLVNGKEADAEVNITEKTNADGEKYYDAEVKIKSPDTDSDYEYNINYSIAKDSIVGDSDEIDAAIADALEIVIEQTE